MSFNRLQLLLPFLFCTLSNTPATVAQSIEPTLVNPIAPRGGVMAIPLRASGQTTWPKQIEITLENGQTVTGTVVWIEAQSRSRITWTSNPAPLSIRVVRPEDDPAINPGQALLLAAMPADGTGEISLLDRTLQPTWRDIPDISSIYPVPQGTDPTKRPMLVRHEGAGRPLPDDPLAQWRWWLLATRLERSPPTFSDQTPAHQLVATHYVNLWAIGLGRLTAVNPGVARTCCDLLTRTGQFEDRVIALWVADPNVTWALLTDLLNFQLSNQEVTRRALQWCDQQNLVLLYATNVAGPRVELTAINGYARKLVARFHWLGEGIPLAIELKGLQETTARLDRPVQDAQSLDLLPQRVAQIDPLTLPNTLQAEVHGHFEQLDLGPGRFDVKPPGLTLGPLSPPHTLAALQRSASIAPSKDELTLVELRRVQKQWELMFVCRTATISRSQIGSDHLHQAPITTLEGMRHREAVAIFLGQANPHILVVEADSSTTSLARTIPGADVTAFTTVEQDRWLARVLLPEALLSEIADRETNTIQLGFVRSHANSSNIETAPLPSLPWEIEPGRVEINLSSWSDYPTAEDASR